MERLTKRQAAVIGAYTGILAGPSDEMHEYVEVVMDRPVFTHEMGSKRISDEIKEAAYADFMELVREVPK